MSATRGLVDMARSPGGKKMVRYTAVSVISVIVSQIVLFFAYSVVHMSAGWANVVAVCVGTVPSYELNRKWAWGKTGRGHFWKEVAPFWSLSFVGLLFSTFAVDAAESWSSAHHASHLLNSMVVNGANLAAFGVLWVGKFIFFNKVLFAHHPEDLEPALDGRTGIPT